MGYKVKAERKRPWKVHSLANCMECNWEEGGMNTATEEARRHTAQTGHTTIYETAYVNHLSAIKENK